jgi:predicted dehydrogenase
MNQNVKKINVGLIGHKFMGRAHTHGYTDLPIFFDAGVTVVKKTICADEENIGQVAARWGWEKATLDWQDLIDDPEIDLVDIAAPSAIHAQVAIAAAKAGKHVFCEKPLALSLADAQAMVAAVDKAGVVNMIGFSYRCVPALALAKQMIDSGEIGEIYHFRGIYQQSWLVDPGFPLVWRLQRKDAGYGPHGDLGAHVVDLARWLVGEIDQVCCMQQTFIRERPKPSFVDGLIAKAGTEKGIVDVDDASAFLLRFKGQQTMGYIEATRFGTGHRNQHHVEINGSKGAIIFDMEKMNELQVYQNTDQGHAQGYRRVLVGEGVHPYMANWWPAGHIIGYGEIFVNQMYNLVTAIKEKRAAKPDFHDGLICQYVLDAAERSALSNGWEKVAL